MTISTLHDGKDFRLANAPLSNRHGILRADDVDDLYFSADNGIAESQHVFLAGNDLQARLVDLAQVDLAQAGLAHFTIAETGFGTGLNFLALMNLMDDLANVTGSQAFQIDYISFESRPLDAAVMAQSHALFPAVAQNSKDLIACLPPRWPGLHRRDFKGGRLRLHLLYGAAELSLKKADFRADAWFLDGFSPAKNPQLWSAELLCEVGRLTKAGGSFASFTAARSVRDNLTAAGFDVEKRPGFGHKREMIIGRKAGSLSPKTALSQPKLGIIGGGIAGAAVAAGLIKRGIEAHIIDAKNSLAAGASGNRLGLQSPRLSVDHNTASRMSADCLSYAAHYSDLTGASIYPQVISLDWPEREAVRQDKFRRQFWPDDLMQFTSAQTASALAGIDLPLGGAVYPWGRVIDPKVLTSGLAAGAVLHLGFDVAQINRHDGRFMITGIDGRHLDFDYIVAANGAALDTALSMLEIDGVRTEITSGQVSQVPAIKDFDGLGSGISFGGYLTPAFEGLHELGASFDRSGTSEISAVANLHNRQLLPDELAKCLPDPVGYGARVSRRASTPDRNPVLGKVADGVFVIGALGARGLTLAPLLGDMLAAEIIGTPVTLATDIRDGLDPFRFRLRPGGL